MLVSGSVDRTTCVWETVSQQLITFFPIQSKVLRCYFSPPSPKQQVGQAQQQQHCYALSVCSHQITALSQGGEYQLLEHVLDTDRIISCFFNEQNEQLIYGTEKGEVHNLCMCWRSM